MVHRKFVDRLNAVVQSTAGHRSLRSRTTITILSLLLVTYMYLSWSFEESRIVYIKRNNGLGLAAVSLGNSERGFCKTDVQDDTSAQVHVLLNAYMRSGSYFVGQLLTDIPDTFPYMEPLWRLSVFGYFTMDNKLCNTVWPTCRTAVPDLRKAYRIIKSIYNCQLDKIRSLIVAQIRHPVPLQVAEVWRTYARCNATESSCFSSLIQNCTGSRIRVTKIIRMSLAATRHMLETDKALKILQLVRDPRGIICSRLLKTDWYPLKLSPGNYTPVVINAGALCKRMADDYAAGKQLRKSFPNRVKFIRYDDLIYSFRQAVWNNVTRFLGVHGRTVRNELKDTPFDWRKLLNRDVLNIVDQECSYVYKVLGYIPLRHEELGNMSLLSFRPYYEVG